jgi:hypothetical protein
MNFNNSTSIVSINLQSFEDIQPEQIIFPLKVLNMGLTCPNNVSKMSRHVPDMAGTCHVVAVTLPFI